MHQYFSTGQFKNVIKTVHERCKEKHLPVPVLDFKGTVKLHGSNSSVYNVLSNTELVMQSKNNIISVEKDNYGFANFVMNETDIFQKMFEKIKLNHPEDVQNQTAVIYGEFCGEEIQKLVALSQLNKMFVVFGIKLIDNDAPEDTIKYETWLEENEIHDILDYVGKPLLKEKNIYTIYDFPTFEIKVDMANPKLVQNDIINITLEVEKECPVAKTLGVVGVGEGVVWKCITRIPEIETQDLVFKVKGKEHSVTNVSSLAPVDVQKVNSIKEFVDAVLTENRLNQGIEYLKEQHLEIIPQNMSVFLKWVGGDCLKEEGDTLEASGLLKKDVMPEVSHRCKQWFFSYMQDHSKKMKI